MGFREPEVEKAKDAGTEKSQQPRETILVWAEDLEETWKCTEKNVAREMEGKSSMGEGQEG